MSTVRYGGGGSQGVVDAVSPDSGPERRRLAFDLAGYVDAWRETVSVGGTATGLSWTVPDLPSGAVAFYPIEVRTCRADGCCSRSS